MPIPDFSKQTVEILARRARYQCSNPDCGAQTVGPNSNPDKATIIGEAAHISGAKSGSMRYDTAMSDITRASITNGIWLCRNCHGLVDRDEVNYPINLLFAWRKAHEDRVLCELGTRGERIRHEVEMSQISYLSNYPPIIQRIVIDRPAGWEYRLTSELMKHLNKPQLKRLANLQAGHYFKPAPRIPPHELIDWLQERSHVMLKLVEPFESLMSRLTNSWGARGETGDAEEIHDVCILVRDMLTAMVEHEELIKFAYLPPEGEELRSTLMDAIGRNAQKLAEAPQKLDEVVALIDAGHDGTEDEPLIFTWTLVFDLPADFSSRVNEALQRYMQALAD